MTELIKTDENKTNKYHNAKIYKIVNDVDDKVYYGSTCQPLYKRLYDHKNHCKDENKKSLIYTHYRNIGSDNMKIILVEEYKCNNKMELEKKEREYIEQYKGENSLNKNIPTRSIKEWYEQNKDNMKEYYEKNKDNIKEYYEKNKEKINEKNKRYAIENKEKIKEYRNSKVLCDCGYEYSKTNKSRHMKSKKHSEYIKNK